MKVQFWVSLLLFLGAVGLLSGCRGKLDETMAEFVTRIEKVRSANLPEDEFYERVGTEPHKTVTLADKSYWYFYCSDGKVILSVDAILLKDEGKVKVYPGIRQIEK